MTTKPDSMVFRAIKSQINDKTQIKMQLQEMAHGKAKLCLQRDPPGEFFTVHLVVS